jgi:GntR family transcriptional regulator, arabinose operon transcriptional repressor
MNNPELVKERSLRRDLREVRPGQAKYERLKEHLVSEMLAGRLRPGQALPGERHLEETLGIARLTIRQAMASLESDGLIRRVQGKGNFVESDARKKLNRGQDIFALVVPETRVGFYPALLHGFEAAAGDIHHQTLICNTDDDVGRQADIMMQLLDKEVGGVAVNPTSEAPTPAYQIRLLQKHGVPVVFCHRRVDGITAPLLAIPFYEVGRLAGKALVDRGHRRVAFFTAWQSAPVHAYEDGLREALQAGGSDIPPELIHHVDTDREEEIWPILQRMFAMPSPPTAIFSTFDSQAEIIYLLLPRLGVRVPEDVSLMGFGGAWRDGALMRRLTSVVVDEIATGKKAVSLLHEMRRGDRPIDDNEEFVMKLSLSEGETVGPPSSKALSDSQSLGGN